MSKRERKGIEYRALRRKEEGIFERLLCQKLISSNNADAIDKILKMAEAVFMHNGKLEGIDKDEVDTVYSVALAFRDSYHYKINGLEYCNMTWGFEETEKNYKRYIRPWKRQGSLSYYTFWPPDSYLETMHDEVLRDKEKARLTAKLNTLKESCDSLQFFLVTTGGLGTAAVYPLVSFKRLRNQFIMWAIPRVQKWYETLASKIDKDIFDSVLKTMYGPREPERVAQ